jgi:hypothetical protein
LKLTSPRPPYHNFTLCSFIRIVFLNYMFADLQIDVVSIDCGEDAGKLLK